MKTWFIYGASCLLCCCSCFGQQPKSAGPEAIEMQAVLFSNCLKPQSEGPEDLWPVRIVNIEIKKVREKALVEFHEVDEACKYNLAKSSEWTTSHFESVKMLLKSAGLNGTIMPSESSGNNFPISFLKVQSSDLKGEVYTMYLRFRWSGKLNTEDPRTARILNEWRSVFLDATQQIERFKM